MRTRSLRDVCVVLAAGSALAACSSGANARDGLVIGIATPVFAYGALDSRAPVYGTVDLVWTSPNVAQTVRVEVQVGGTWQPRGDFPFAPGAARVWLPAAPEMTVFHLRASAIRGATQGPYSNEVEFTLGVRPPYVSIGGVTEDSPWTRGSIHLLWSRTSSVATRERLERAVIGSDGTMQGVTELTLAPGASSFDDTDFSGWIDGAEYEYHVLSIAGADESLPGAARTTPGRVPAPDVIATVPSPGHVHLQWTQRSAIATGTSVARDLYLAETPIGTFPLATTSLDDVINPGIYTYWLHAVAPPDPTFGTAPRFATVPVLVPDGPIEGAARTSARIMPAGIGADRTSVGTFAIVNEGFDVRFSTPDMDRWAQAGQATNFAVFFHPAVLVDATDVAHAFYIDDTVSPSRTSCPVHHAWRDAAGPHDEIVSPGPSEAYRRGAAAIAADGSLRTAWVERVVDPAVSLASSAGGAWTVSSTPVPPDSDPMSLAVEPTGATQVLVRTGTDYQILRQDVSGTWTSDAIPASSPALAANVGLLAAAEGASLLAYDVHLPDASWEVWILERDGAGWHAPARLGPGALDAVALSRDRSRAAVAAGVIGGTSFLYVREGGTWRAVPLLPLFSEHVLAAGFTPQGRWWVLQGLYRPGAMPSGVSAYGIYDEP